MKWLCQLSFSLHFLACHLDHLEILILHFFNHTHLSQGILSFRSFVLEKKILLALLYIWDKNMGFPADQEGLGYLIFTQEISVMFMKDRLGAPKENTTSSQNVMRACKACTLTFSELEPSSKGNSSVICLSTWQNTWPMILKYFKYKSIMMILKHALRRWLKLFPIFLNELNAKELKATPLLPDHLHPIGHKVLTCWSLSLPCISSAAWHSVTMLIHQSSPSLS